MKLKISKAAAGLTFHPSVWPRLPRTELARRYREEGPQTGMFGSDRIHEARLRETCDKQGMLLLTRRNLKNEHWEWQQYFGLPLSQVRLRRNPHRSSPNSSAGLSLPSIRAAVSPIACSIDRDLTLRTA